MIEFLLIIIILILLSGGNKDEHRNTGRNVHCNPPKFKKPPIPKKAFGMNVKEKIEETNQEEETHETKCR